MTTVQVQQYMDLLGAHAEELIRQGRQTGNDEDDTEEYGAVLRAGLQSLQRVRAQSCGSTGSQPLWLLLLHTSMSRRAVRS